MGTVIFSILPRRENPTRSPSRNEEEERDHTSRQTICFAIFSVAMAHVSAGLLYITFTTPSGWTILALVLSCITTFASLVRARVFSIKHLNCLHLMESQRAVGQRP